MPAHADAGRFAQQNVNHGVADSGGHDHGQQIARTILFHQRRREKDFQRACRVQAFEGVIIPLRIHVVNIRFQHGDGIGIAWRVCRDFADAQAQHVWNG